MIEPTTPKDDLAGDLIRIVHDELGDPDDYKALLEALTIYVTARDHKVHTHAYQLGRASV